MQGLPSRFALALVLVGACAVPPEPVAPAVPPPPAPPTPLTVLPPPGHAKAPELPEPILRLATVTTGHGAADVVESLTTEVGARLAGSAGDPLAVAWAERTLRERGLSNVHTEPVKVPVWQRGEESAAIVSPHHKLSIAALGWSGATSAKGILADVVRFDTLDALKAADPGTVRGKVVFLDVHMHETAEDPGYGAAVGARASGPGEAAKKGALAIVIRSIGTDATRFPHTGSMRREKDAKSALPAAAVSNADADLLERVIATHGSLKLSLTLTPRWLPDADSANVVGEIVGREKPDEVVIMGAHLDSWDLGEGALDDGAGCGIVVEAGRALAALPTRPRRTVRVVLFAAEENSLAGGKAYAALHGAQAGSFVGAMEADSGTNRVVRAGVRAGPEGVARFSKVLPLLEPLGVLPLEERAYGGADIGPLAELGVPLVDLRQDHARYFEDHHTANDTFGRIDPAGLNQAAAAFAATAWALADMDGDLGRIPETERHPDK